MTTLRTRLRLTGTIISYLVLGVIDSAAALWIAWSWIFHPGSQQHYVKEIAAGAFIGGSLGCIALLLTIIPASLRWVSTKWYWVPIVVILLSVARFSVL